MENRFNLDAPVIATGRGGSGTRLLSIIMHDIKMFIGSELNRSGDSLEWVPLSRELLSANATILNGGYSTQWIERFRQYAEFFLSRAPAEDYSLWGWKLPEMMFCLPEMLQTFPQAKIIHLIRHPVSLSLRRTHLSSRLGNDVGDVVLPRAYESLGLDAGMIAEQPDYINNAVSWEYQLSRVVEYARTNLDDRKYLPIKYEDLVRRQDEVVARICRFLEVENTGIAPLDIYMKRANQCFESDDRNRIDDVWSICGNTAETLGYEKSVIG